MVLSYAKKTTLEGRRPGACASQRRTATSTSTSVGGDARVNAASVTGPCVRHPPLEPGRWWAFGAEVRSPRGSPLVAPRRARRHAHDVGGDRLRVEVNCASPPRPSRVSDCSTPEVASEGVGRFGSARQLVDVRQEALGITGNHRSLVQAVHWRPTTANRRTRGSVLTDERRQFHGQAVRPRTEEPWTSAPRSPLRTHPPWRGAQTRRERDAGLEPPWVTRSPLSDDDGAPATPPAPRTTARAPSCWCSRSHHPAARRRASAASRHHLRCRPRRPDPRPRRRRSRRHR